MSQGEEADGLFSFPFLSSLSFLPLSFPPFLLSSRWISHFSFPLHRLPLPSLSSSELKRRKKEKGKNGTVHGLI